MPQNTQSATADRNTVPGTANEKPLAPQLFTTAPRREYVPDAKRMNDLLQTPEMARARAAFDEGNFAAARAEAKRVLRRAEASTEAKMEAGDLLDRTAIDQGPIAAAVSFLILLGLLLMYFATNGK
ncbi:MAG TPA: hypothetical protein VIZ58_09100 [Thermoanaerobaculia bacterium]